MVVHKVLDRPQGSDSASQWCRGLTVGCVLGGAWRGLILVGGVVHRVVLGRAGLSVLPGKLYIGGCCGRFYLELRVSGSRARLRRRRSTARLRHCGGARVSRFARCGELVLRGAPTTPGQNHKAGAEKQALPRTTLRVPSPHTKQVHPIEPAWHQRIRGAVVGQRLWRARKGQRCRRARWSQRSIGACWGQRSRGACGWPTSEGLAMVLCRERASELSLDLAGSGPMPLLGATELTRFGTVRRRPQADLVLGQWSRSLVEVALVGELGIGEGVR
ncbi:hypothetical protein CLV68_2279 [Actinokineospora cianjurensis]|uniref:Uncharacterized protein n=1 Tax=Actinokineospora cianjurensis TaxID=585224 RepID=A0A421BBL3_9PSEU|nr:hypothetical protein CLV68_2279 [Actinokineospora cianjurensis]